MFRSSARPLLRFAATQQGRRFSSSATSTATAASKSKSNAMIFAASSAAAVTIYAVLNNGNPVENAFFSFGPNIPQAKADLAAMIDEDMEKRGDGTSIAPTLVRLAWHASGTYSVNDKTGGSNGATMRFSPEKDWGANAGLQIARDFVEKIKKKHNLSYADAWTLAGVVAIAAMGGPIVPWKEGRKDSSAPTTVPDGRLPNADMGCPQATSSHIRDIFYRMGFDDREIVALSGAHALGRCHTDASGYWGPWTRAETTFSNEYFRLLIEEKWTVKKTHEGKPWTGPLQYESPDGTLMMLPSDLALVQDPKFRKYVDLYAKDEETFCRDFAAAFGKLLALGVTE